MQNIIILLVVGLLSAQTTSAKIFVEKTDCKDLMTIRAIDFWFKSKDPSWFLPYLSKMQNKTDEVNKSWFHKNQHRFNDENEIKTAKNNWILKNPEFSQWIDSPQNPVIRCNLHIAIYDKITSDDPKKLKNLLREFKNSPFLNVDLVSQGGDVYAAMELGRIIREHYGNVHVGISEWRLAEIGKSIVKHHQSGEQSKVDELSGIYKAGRREIGCYSACALIYAGGIARELVYNPKTSGSFPIGLHQHFISSQTLSKMNVTDAVRFMKTATKDIEIYLEEMGVPNKFLEKAMSVSKNDMVFLEDKEISRLIPFAQPEYAAILIEKSEWAAKNLSNLLWDSVPRVEQKMSLNTFLNKLMKIRNESFEEYQWATYESYYLNKAQHSQKFWNSR